ncbi:hypothetical protein R6Q59_035401 [Mikania micrantha]
MLILRDTRRSPRKVPSNADHTPQSPSRNHLPPVISRPPPSMASPWLLTDPSSLASFTIIPINRLHKPSLKPYTKPPPIRSVLRYNRKPELAGTTPRVVVITSGKGGVGKTTTTANVGLSLPRLGFSVNYTVVEVLNGDCRLDQALVRDKRWSNFELLCISKLRSKLPLGFGGQAQVWLVNALKDRQEGCPDFILIDCLAGIYAGFITTNTLSNKAVLVTTPDITALRDADRQNKATEGL